MAHPASRVESQGCLPCKQGILASECHQKIDCALTIIFGLGCLAAAAVGIAAFGGQCGWWKVGALSNLAQVYSLFLMSVGGGWAIVLLTTGIVESVKSYRQSGKVLVDPELIYRNISEPILTNDAYNERYGGIFFGPDAYFWCGIQVRDQAPPPPPHVDWNSNDPFFNRPFRENYIHLYIPEWVECLGREVKKFTPLVFAELLSNERIQLNQRVMGQFGQTTRSGWVLISKRGIPTPESDFDDSQGFRLPYFFEAVVAKFILNGLKKESIYNLPILCSEKPDGRTVTLSSFLTGKIMVELLSPMSDLPERVVVRS